MQSQHVEHDENVDTALAANALFANNLASPTLSDGRQVKILEATMNQIPIILAFIQLVLESVDKTQLAELIDLIVKRQQEAIAAGADPYKIDLKELATEELVAKAFGNVSLLLTLANTAMTHLPHAAETFTDLKKGEFGKLKIDDGVMVLVGIFAVNYGFFTRSLLPILTVSIRKWVASVNNAKSQQNIS